MTTSIFMYKYIWGRKREWKLNKLKNLSFKYDSKFWEEKKAKSIEQQRTKQTNGTGKNR